MLVLTRHRRVGSGSPEEAKALTCRHARCRTLVERSRKNPGRMPGFDDPSLRLNWNNPATFGPWTYVCGFCDAKVGPNTGYFANIPELQLGAARVYICPNCTRPTLAVGMVHAGTYQFDVKIQVPMPSSESK